ncbi:uncharacterized protein [Solanum lycopersicum]|uniref:uncharacterized protein isoform X2 n=1 Tax=Solanum lycopersicum TaxID=4081 RepID=UPI0037498457
MMVPLMLVVLGLKKLLLRIHWLLILLSLLLNCWLQKGLLLQRSQDYNAVLYCLRQLFEKVEVDKPPASRSASAEIYIICLKYKAPSKIDPRLLDIKHLFQGGKEPPKVIDVLGATKQKRHRDGYEDGATVLRKVCSVADFVWSDNPVQVLGSFTSMSFEDPACLAIRDHTLTTEEVKSLCDDLRVLAKQEFKYLLKWRMQIRKALSPEKIKTLTVFESESKEGEDEDEDERVLNEIEEKTNILEKKQKKEKKLQAKRRAKEKARKALGIQVDATEDGYGDQDLFSLSSIKGKKDLLAVDNSEYNKQTTEVSDESDEEAQEHSSSDLDSEDERRRHDDNIEALFDEAYERYLGRVEGKSKQRKRSKQAHLKDDLQDGNDDSMMIDSAQDSESDMEDNEVNPLVVPLEDAPPQEEIMKMWFTQDVFAEAEEQDVLDMYDINDEMQIDGGTKKIQQSKELTNDKQQGETKDMTRRKTNGGLQVSASKADDDFEIVPAPATDSSDSSSDESDDDIDTKAEILSTAKMTLKKRPREEMIDDAYNRYMFHDEGLPKWFVDEEKRNFQPVKPVTKEEIAAMRAQFKAIDARPAKKVAEAKARKKRAAHRKLEKFRKKANSISDQTEISEGSKRKMIEQLYRKAASTKKPEREYVVAKKGVQVKIGKGKVLVDPRMKKDARKHGMKKKTQPKRKRLRKGFNSSLSS